MEATEPKERNVKIEVQETGLGENADPNRLSIIEEKEEAQSHHSHQDIDSTHLQIGEGLLTGKRSNESF